MKKPIILLAITFFTVIGFFLLFKSTSPAAGDRLFVNDNSSLLANYDMASGTITPAKNSFIQVTVQWFDNKVQPFPHLLDSLISLNKPLLIYLEIYDRNRRFRRDVSAAQDILNGMFDNKLGALAEKFQHFDQPILISYNQDIELPLNNYPWQLKDAGSYINSFAHIGNKLKTITPSIKTAWSVGGYPGCDEYYPGDSVTDYNIVSLSNLPDVKDGPYNVATGLAETLRRKLFRLRFFNQPVLIMGKDSLNGSALRAPFTDSLNGRIQPDLRLYFSPQRPFNYDSVNNVTNKTAPIFGLFDRANALVREPGINAEHFFLDFQGVKTGLLQSSLGQIAQRKHQVILTFEPWKDGKTERDPQLLQNIYEGKYDQYFEDIFKQLAVYPYAAYFRWGHEMEIPVDRYPWQRQDPVVYIKAYRRVRQMQQQLAPHAKMIWGPAGDRGSIEWYPGDDAVDFVSIAIYGLPDKNITDHNQQQAFSNIFQLKLHRMRFAHKPLFITEFGVKGPEDYKQKWLADAAGTISRHPIVKGVCYFNFKDVPGVWGPIETPDWSINQETCRQFIQSLNR